jgi:hypothetical protein
VNISLQRDTGNFVLGAELAVYELGLNVKPNDARATDEAELHDNILIPLPH